MTSALCSTLPIKPVGSRSASPLLFSCAEKFLLSQVMFNSDLMAGALLVCPPIRNIVALSSEHVRGLIISAGIAGVFVPVIVNAAGIAGINVGPDRPYLMQIVSLFDRGGIPRLIQLRQVFLVDPRAISLNPGFPSGGNPLPFSVKRGPVERSPDLLRIVKVEKITRLVIRFGGSRNNYHGENNGKYH